MSLALAGPSVLHRYDALLSLLAARERGRTLADLGDCWTLAGALEEPEPDPAIVAHLMAHLGLQGADLDDLIAQEPPR